MTLHIYIRRTLYNTQYEIYINPALQCSRCCQRQYIVLVFFTFGDDFSDICEAEKVKGPIYKSIVHKQLKNKAKEKGV